MTVQQAAALLGRGEVVAFPTETVYGLGADVWNPEAVRKIFTIKGRPDDNPLIVHLCEAGQVTDFAAEIPEAAGKLMKHCWPGPLTLIFRKKPVVLDLVTSGLPTVALRMPDHPKALALIRLAGPLAAPSANPSGGPSPTKADHVYRDYGSGFPVLEGGDSRVGLESTVLDVTETPFSILRPGSYTVAELAEISGEQVVAKAHQPEPNQPQSPGVKYTHYKPGAQVVWYESAGDPYAGPHGRQEREPSGGPERETSSGPGKRSTGDQAGGASGDPDKIPSGGPAMKPATDLGKKLSTGLDKRKTLLITHTEKPAGFPHHKHYSGDFDRMACELYDQFRTADLEGLPRIAIEPLPEDENAHPLIAALKNRIDKAMR